MRDDEVIMLLITPNIELTWGAVIVTYICPLIGLSIYHTILPQIIVYGGLTLHVLILVY